MGHARTVPRWLVAVLLAGCEPIGPCDEYVDYMCACHADDTGVDCDELSATYATADPDVQDECAVLLDEQETLDQEQGLECPPA